MAYENTNFSKVKKQENFFIKKNEQTEEFLSVCKQYCKNSVKLSSSPWKENKNPIYEMKKLGINKIGKTQSKIIYFLYDFFKKGKPVYFNYENLSKKLNINVKNITRNLKSLETKGLVVKENFKSKNNGGNHQVIIVPNHPKNSLNFYDFLFEKIQGKGKESDGTEAGKSDGTENQKIFCKYSKTLRNLDSKDSLTITTIYHYKDLYNKRFKINFKSATPCEAKEAIKENKKTISLNEASPHCVPSGRDSFSLISKNVEKKPMRQTLKRKSTLASNEALPQEKKNISDKFKQRKKPLDKNKTLDELKNIFDELKNKPVNTRFVDLKTINKFNSLVNKEYGFEYDIKELLFVKNLNKDHELIDNRILFKLFDLLYDGAKLNFSKTQLIIQHFNSKENKSFVKTEINKDSKVCKKLNIIISSLLQKYSISELKTAIDRLAKNPWPAFKYKKKINLLDFLVNPKEEKYLSVYLNEEDERDITSALVKPNTKYEKAQEKWKEVFISYFLDKEQGEKIYKRYKAGIYKFLEYLIDKIKEGKVQVYNYDLLVKKKDTEGALLDLYLDYLDYMCIISNKFPDVREILNMNNWYSFIEDRMIAEFELDGFFYPKKKNNDIDNDYEEE